MSNDELGGGGIGFQKVRYRNEDPGTGEGHGQEVNYEAMGQGSAQGGPAHAPFNQPVDIPANGAAVDVVGVMIHVTGGIASGQHQYQSTGPIDTLDVVAGQNGMQGVGFAGGRRVDGHFVN